jgi:hypothetical protein
LLHFFFVCFEGLFRVPVLPVGDPEDDRQPGQERHFQQEWEPIPWFEVGHICSYRFQCIGVMSGFSANRSYRANGWLNFGPEGNRMQSELP